jgi:putative FmdB family regulatory protein
MPLYEYHCKKCKHTFEKIQSFSDAPVKKCPKCGGPVEKLLSAPAVQFKGTGWYATDYAGKGKAKAPATDAPSSDGAAEGAKVTESTSDSQPSQSETKKSESKKKK